MQAVLCKSFGLPNSLVVQEIPAPKAKRGQVVVDIKACGVNFADMLLVAGKYQANPKFPFIPGSDIAGIVSEIGSGVEGFSIGQPVLAMLPTGGFAEKVACSTRKVIPLPPGTNLEIAAASTIVFGTSYYALKQRAALKKSEKLLVLGAAGGCGLAAIQLGKVMGAYVIAAASTKEKLHMAKKAGADEVVNYSEEKLGKWLKKHHKKGVDVIYDPVGGEFAEPALRCMAFGGRYLVIGFAAGSIPKIPLNLPLLKTCAIVGVFWGNWATRNVTESLGNMMELSQMLAKGVIDPYITKAYGLDDAWKALEDIRQRRVIGKVIIVPAKIRPRI
uniref:Enoyl reductase (ER) domain-containing protein n=1 Tax=Amorphochlora amoebiformis TaxID=1561963 RepID=A0A7S0CQ62_9EUKA|mmetsp:Transcript_11660/g.18478  ORF Transcript_11660/g.18478 Transcript_11660/m.18478 type:complete len:331 (+) Transcript_11660:76-1068(+)